VETEAGLRGGASLSANWGKFSKISKSFCIFRQNLQTQKCAVVPRRAHTSGS